MDRRTVILAVMLAMPFRSRAQTPASWLERAARRHRPDPDQIDSARLTADGT